jgi:hypothetical protein
MKNYTDLEQSKKLAEILPIKSADMHYNDWNDDFCVGYKHTGEYIADLGAPTIIRGELEIPCWSLAALLNLLPSEFTEKGKYSETTYKIHIRKYALTKDVDLHQIAYGSYKWYEDGGYTWHDMINTGEKENLIDAAFQMICWLKENNKI